MTAMGTEMTSAPLVEQVKSQVLAQLGELEEVRQTTTEEQGRY